MAKLLEDVLKENYAGYKFQEQVYLPYDKTTAHSCREYFHDYLYTRKLNCWDFYHYHPYYSQLECINSVIASISFFENSLNIKDQIVVTPVDLTFSFDYQKVRIYHFKIPVFWQDPIRYNLLTLIIKNSPIRNLEEIVKKGTNISLTYDSIKYFLEGNVCFTGNYFKGWVADFSREDYKTLLSKTPIEKEIKMMFHQGWVEHKTVIR